MITFPPIFSLPEGGVRGAAGGFDVQGLGEDMSSGFDGEPSPGSETELRRDLLVSAGFCAFGMSLGPIYGILMRMESHRSGVRLDILRLAEM